MNTDGHHFPYSDKHLEMIMNGSTLGTRPIHVWKSVSYPDYDINTSAGIPAADIEEVIIMETNTNATKKTVILEFDGVIHSYTSGWQGPNVIPDPPVEGILEAIRKLNNDGYRVVVRSNRCEQIGGRYAINRWLAEYGFDNLIDSVVANKYPDAVAYVSDRVINFDGNTSLMVDRIERFVPYSMGGRSEAYHGPLFDHPYVEVIAKCVGNRVDNALKESVDKLYSILGTAEGTSEAVKNAVVNVICLSAVKLNSMGLSNSEIMDAIGHRLTEAVMPTTQGTGAHDEDVPPDAQ